MQRCFRVFSIAALVVLCGCAYFRPAPGNYGYNPTTPEMSEHERVQADVQRVQQGMGSVTPR